MSLFCSLLQVYLRMVHLEMEIMSTRVGHQVIKILLFMMRIYFLAVAVMILCGRGRLMQPPEPLDGIEIQCGPGHTPPHCPGGGVAIPVPEDSGSSMELIPDGSYGPSTDDDRPRCPMEYIRCHLLLLLQEDLQTHLGQSSRSLIPIRLRSRRRACHRQHTNGLPCSETSAFSAAWSFASMS